MRIANAHGFYELNPFPGCNQIVVSNHAFIYRGFRGEGKGQTQHQERLFEAKRLGYDFVMCTVKSTNEVEKHILEKYKWQRMASFVSKETENEIEIFGRLL